MYSKINDNNNTAAIKQHALKLIAKINRLFVNKTYTRKALFYVIVGDKRETCVRAFESYYAHFTIYININHVNYYANTVGISDIAAAKAFICHEVFHVLRDHFNPKYRAYDHQLFNIACDLEVNAYLNLDKNILLRAESYGFKDFLSAEMYYKLLIEKYSQPKNNSAFDKITVNEDNEPVDSSMLIDDIFATSEKEADKLSKRINELSHIKESSSLNAAEVISKELQKLYEGTTIKGLKELVNHLVREEHTVSISPKSKNLAYTKFNNRRKNGNIILPGTKYSGNGIKKKIQKSLTVFIDMSGSTMDINGALNTVAYTFYKNGAYIVFYTSHVVSIIEPNEPFKSISSLGGTDIATAIIGYTKTHKLERAYIITDGLDNSITTLNDVIPKYSVYYINNKWINELCNNNHPITDIKELKRRCREFDI